MKIHKRLPSNDKGRDFIVADIHGCFDMFKAKLDEVNFDPKVDRVFSVGDLTDRGPSNMQCLELLKQSWFHAVRGNHEQMVLDYFFPAESENDIPVIVKMLINNGGQWVRELSPEQRTIVEDLMLIVKKLPYVISMGSGANQFNIVHSELMADSPRVYEYDSFIFTDDDLLNEELLQKDSDYMNWGRRVVKPFDKHNSQQEKINTEYGVLSVTDQPWQPGLSLTYCGHTILENMGLHKSHLFIDLGACINYEKPDGEIKHELMFIEYRKMLKYLPDRGEV